MIDQQTLLGESEAPPQDDPPQPPAPRRKFPWPMGVVVALFVLLLFFSWYGSWFGRPLSDAKMESYLNDKEKPRNVQHALSQIAGKIMEGDEAVKRWYPSVLMTAEHPTPEVRLTAAWVMGQDNKNEDFHRMLLSMLKDTHPGVRHNAALSLVRFNDPAARQELSAMLEPHILKAGHAGIAELIIEEEGVAVAAGSPLVRIKQDDGQVHEVRSPEEGRIEMLAVSDLARVQPGDQLLVLSPGVKQVENTLVALMIVGQPDDIPAIQRYTRSLSGMPDRIQKQALATIEAIRSRSGK